MRFFTGYTFQSILEMRASQFFALNKQIDGLTKEEEARALTIHHASKPDVRLREILADLNASRRIKHVADSSLALITRGEAQAVASAELDAERERQRLNWELMKRDRAAWMEQMKAEVAKRNAISSSTEPSSEG